MQYLSLVLCLYLQSLTDCKVPLSQGPGYVWRWLLIVMISDRGLIYDEMKDWAESKANGARDVESSSSVRIANSKARIKPTAPLLAFDKENSIEFPLDFLHYLYKWLTLTLY